MVVVMAAIGIGIASGSASAQPGVTPAMAPQVELKPRHQKSELLAGSLSFGLTAAGFATLLVTNSLAEPDNTGRRLRPEYQTPLYLSAGVLLAVGPTTGHIYAGKIWNRGLAVRLASGAVVLVAAANIDNVSSESDHNGNGTAAGIAVAAGIVYLGASIYECAIAPRAVRRYNERNASPTLAIAPMLSSREQGVAIVGRF